MLNVTPRFALEQPVLACAARMARMAMTTSSSINVKPRFRLAPVRNQLLKLYPSRRAVSTLRRLFAIIGTQQCDEQNRGREAAPHHHLEMPQAQKTVCGAQQRMFSRRSMSVA